jgi:RNA polymerase sigma-70 factor (ECF subfamily)
LREQPDDQALLTAIAGGDLDAVGVLYDRYAGLLLTLGRRIARGSNEAEDVLQRVFQTLWREAGTLLGEVPSLRTWLLLRTRALALEGRAASEADAVRAACPSALAALSEHERRVLELTYFEGLSAAQIAARLDAPAESIRAGLRTALSKLRRPPAAKLTGVGA